jgi:hypothetical protein
LRSARSNAAASNFWERVYQIASSEFPDLKMRAPSKKGSQSKWIIFKAGLPARITIDWKITMDAVDLSYWKGAFHTPIPSINLSELRPGATTEALGETATIRVPLSRTPALWIEMTNDQIQDGLKAASELLGFYRSNPAYFK